MPSWTQLRNYADTSPKRAPLIAIARLVGLRLTARVPASYIGFMRPETRRNRNPLSIDHAFT